MQRKESIEKLVAEILDGTALHLRVDSYTMTEDLEASTVDFHCNLHDERTGQALVIHGQGVGLVDAAFQGLMQAYAERFASLRTIRFADFSIQAKLDTGRHNARSDMAATVTLRIANSEGHAFVFEHSSPSITRSAVALVVASIEFFINSERAFVCIYQALQHARAEKRADSVARYTAQLATLVEATSYSETIENIRRASFPHTLSRPRAPAAASRGTPRRSSSPRRPRRPRSARSPPMDGAG